MVVGMTEAETTPMRCPWSVCVAELVPVIHRTDPRDETARVMVYPIHAVEGGASWFGRCPASQLVVPFLTAAGRSVLSDATKVFLRMAAERAQKAREQRDRVSEIVHDMIDHPERWRDFDKRKTPPPPSVEDYFPGRPADAPEPGVGDEPAAKIPLDKLAGHSQPLGKAEAMTTREQHLAMIAATRAKIGESQDALGRVYAGLEALEGVAALLPPNVEAASSLADATVGVLADNNLPESALKMRVQLAAAKDTTTGTDGIAGAIRLVRMRIDALAQQLAVASAAAEEYQQRP